MKKMDKIIIKLGGALITEKNREDFPTDINEIEKRADEFIKYEILKKLAKEISRLKVKLIIINGAGPFGHFLVDKGCDAETVHFSVKSLNQKIIDIFKKENLEVVPVHPYETCNYKRGVCEDELWKKTKQVLDNGKIPITYGDVIPITKKDYEVISGDDLSVELAKRWKADKIIMLTDVNGVFTKDPKIYSDAKFIPELRETKNIKFKLNNIDVTGGLQSKIKKLFSVNIPSQIINGLESGNLEKAISGESIGTVIRQ